MVRNFTVRRDIWSKAWNIIVCLSRVCMVWLLQLSGHQYLLFPTDLLHAQWNIEPLYFWYQREYHYELSVSYWSVHVDQALLSHVEWKILPSREIEKVISFTLIFILFRYMYGHFSMFQDHYSVNFFVR